MPKAIRLPWVPEWLVNSQKARVGLSVLVDQGKEPPPEEWEGLWVDRIKELAQEESVRDLDQVRMWEDLQGGQMLVRKVQHLLGLLGSTIAPGLWYQLQNARAGNQEARQELLEKFPQEDPAPSPEERLEELREAGLNGLVSGVADPSPHLRAQGQ